MATMYLGVLDVAYSDPDNKALTTTGEVAEVLEEVFNVMATFLELYGQRIADLMGQYTADKITAMAKGMEHGGNPVQNLTNKMQVWFRDFLETREWERATGITIGAAEQGVSHRFKDVQNKAGKRGSRPAFVDTGLYQAAFRAWFDHWAPAEAESTMTFQKFKTQMLSDRASW